VSSNLKPDGLRSALDLVGHRWALWLLTAIDERDGSRFNDLAREPGLSRRVLTEQLGRLIDGGLVRKAKYEQQPPRYRYELTERGQVARVQAQQLVHVVAGGAVPLDRPASASAPLDPAQHPADRLLELEPEAARDIWQATIAPLAKYDEQYSTPLVETLSVYLECDASVGVAAARLYAHRHTVRYRLRRIRELTGLNVDVLADRERLALGLRAARVLRGQ
jgi:DNA-binding HxlR family transcriptional regulator